MGDKNGSGCVSFNTVFPIGQTKTDKSSKVGDKMLEVRK